MFSCKSYEELRLKWKNELSVGVNFDDMLPVDKLRVIFKTKENIKITAQYLISCFDARSKKV